MKRIEAIIRQEKLEDVKASLEKAGYPGMTVTSVQGHGKQKGVTQQWRGMEYKVTLLPKTKIEVTVVDADVEKTLQAIKSSAYTGAVGDGKIFVVDIADVVRIRTGEHGEAALN